jgi:hypothetical protein
MKIGEIKAEHNFKVVCGHHSIIFDFETKSDCRNAMFSLSWYCERENNFYITSINDKRLEVVCTNESIRYQFNSVWVD